MQNVSNDYSDKLLSVIICIYNGLEYLDAAIKSVLENTYKNIEIIIVNDGSTEDVKSSMKKWNNLKNIIYVEHDVNRGLFRSRITGIQHSHGEYIAFLDVDDYVTVDWYRILIKKIEETDSDFVIGDFNLKYEDGYYYMPNSFIRQTDFVLTGDDVQQKFFEQAGLDYSWHVVWNKVYKRKLILNAIKYLDEIKEKIVMCEDVLFSCVFYSLAKKIANCHYSYYIYNKTSSNCTSEFTEYKRHVESINKVFKYIFTFLEKINFEIKYSNYCEEWHDRLITIWINNIKINREKKFLKNYLYDKEFNPSNISENFFYKSNKFKHYQYEDIKREIIKRKIICFDIFDTLILRPFLEPTDLFILMESYLHEITNLIDKIPFRDIRMAAEQQTRDFLYNKNGKPTEVTLDDIYAFMKKAGLLNLDDEKINKIKQLEINLEMKYCYSRKAAKELYELANYLGKKIFIISDMYLPKEVIEEILEKNGYIEYDELFLSSDTQLFKGNGAIYEKLLSSYKADEIFMLGDNWESDVAVPERYGIGSKHFPKPTDLLYNRVSNWLYTGEFFCNLIDSRMPFYYPHANSTFISYRGALGLIANQLFDYPYVNYDPTSDFNGQASRIGYAILGPNILAIVMALMDGAKKYDVINFYARDGWLPYLATKYLNEIISSDKHINYVHVSRKSLIPLSLQKADDLYTLLIRFPSSITVDAIYNYLKPVLSCNAYQFFTGINHLNLQICDKSNLARLLNFIAENYYSPDLAQKYLENGRKYFQKYFSKPAATFDVGYSISADYLLKMQYGYDIKPFMCHVNSSLPYRRAKTAEMSFESFLPYSPKITGPLRETLLSKNAPSCIGYNETGNPVFENFIPFYPEKCEQDVIQDYSLKFFNDFINTFKDDLNKFSFRYFDFSFLFEYFSEYAKLTDREFTKVIRFEDDLSLGYFNSLYNVWNSQTPVADSTENIIQELGNGETQNKIDSPNGRLMKKIIKKSIKYMLPYGLVRFIQINKS